MDTKLVKKLKELHENDPRSHWKRTPDTGMTYNNPARFYLNNKYLGQAFIPELSMSHHRREAARKKGIMYYNRIVIGKRELKAVFVGISGKKYKAFDFIPEYDKPWRRPQLSDPDALTLNGKPVTARTYRRAMHKQRKENANLVSRF